MDIDSNTLPGDESIEENIHDIINDIEGKLIDFKIKKNIILKGSFYLKEEWKTGSEYTFISKNKILKNNFLITPKFLTIIESIETVISSKCLLTSIVLKIVKEIT